MLILWPGICSSIRKGTVTDPAFPDGSEGERLYERNVGKDFRICLHAGAWDIVAETEEGSGPADQRGQAV